MGEEQASGETGLGDAPHIRRAGDGPTRPPSGHAGRASVTRRSAGRLITLLPEGIVAGSRSVISDLPNAI